MISKKIITELIKRGVKNQADLSLFKKEICRKYKINFPSNISLFKAYHKFLKKKKVKKSENLEKILRTKPIRSLSGIVNISVLTKPYPCLAKCVFCPTDFRFPKSYLPGEPAAERAFNLNFDPFLQVQKRIEMLEKQAHPTDKIELRIIGGTWSFYPEQYREWFIKECFRACNEFGEGRNLKNSKFKRLEEEQKKNEKAKKRIVGLAIETRPDCLNEKEIYFLRKLGVTMVEMGVQSLDETVLKISKTGLNLKKIIKATSLLKDSGFKVMYHLLPNLPASTPEKDFQTFKMVFTDERFKPDWLKIYPCVVLKEAELFNWWKEKRYRPYPEKDLIELLIKVKTLTPSWLRIARIYRDIPTPLIKAGSKIAHLRDFIKNEMGKRKLVCRCIRCRQVREDYNPKEKIYLFREDYLASGGKEIFLSFENKKREKIYSYLRLRIPSFVFEKKRCFFSILNDSAIIREIQTFGQLVPIGFKKNAPQHQGLGKKLIREAEKIAKREFGLRKIAVISGIGVRDYFRKQGFKLKESYMIKFLH